MAGKRKNWVKKAASAGNKDNSREKSDKPSKFSRFYARSEGKEPATVAKRRSPFYSKD